MNALEVPGHLELESRILARDLRAWAARDDSRPQAGPRQAVNRVVRSIDRTLAELHALRTQLAAEIRQSGDAAMARTAELLARLDRDGAR